MYALPLPVASLRIDQGFGGNGVSGQAFVDNKAFREIRAFRIYDGPSEVHRWSLAQKIGRLMPSLSNREAEHIRALTIETLEACGPQDIPQQQIATRGKGTLQLALDRDPGCKRLAWRHGVSKNVLDKKLRVSEVANWIEFQVLPTRVKRGRG